MMKSFKSIKRKRELHNTAEREMILIENEKLRPCRKCKHYMLHTNTVIATISCNYPCDFRHKSFRPDTRYKKIEEQMQQA